MLKARGTTETGDDVFVFGLSHANLDRLRAGSPIKFDGRPFGVPGTVLIFAGTDEVSMGRMLVKLNPDVDVRTDPGPDA